MIQQSNQKHAGFFLKATIAGMVLLGLATANAAAQTAKQGRQAATAQAGQATSKVYTVVEQRPEFDGDVNEWLSAHLHYPDSARKKNRQGRVVVEFIVDENGRISHAHTVRSSQVPDLDAEAVRVVTAMPAWRPGRQGGKPVKVYYNLPISFRLEG